MHACAISEDPWGHLVKSELSKNLQFYDDTRFFPQTSISLDVRGGGV